MWLKMQVMGNDLVEIYICFWRVFVLKDKNL